MPDFVLGTGDIPVSKCRGNRLCPTKPTFYWRETDNKE